jgi:hydrogenase maturation protein HypF
MGRLFDAVASLLGLRHRVSYEAQAAIDLEAAAARVDGSDLDVRFTIDDGRFDAATVITALLAAGRSGASTGALAHAFHVAVAELVHDLAIAGCAGGGTDRVVLSGGVFQNALLVSMCTARLRRAGIDPLTHRLVPPNDGGLALGQAFVAAHRPVTSSPDNERFD